MRVTSIIILDRLNTCEKGGKIRGESFYLFMLCLLMRPPPLLLGSSGVVVCTSWSRLTYVPTKYPQPTFSPPKKKLYLGFNVWASSHPLTFLSRIRSILFSSFPFFCSVLHSVKIHFHQNCSSPRNPALLRPPTFPKGISAPWDCGVPFGFMLPNDLPRECNLIGGYQPLA